MVAGTLDIKGERFVIVPEAEFERMRSLTANLMEGAGPEMPMADAEGNVPAVQYMRAGLARRIIRRRRQAGLAQVELARRAGVRTETLCRIEKGKMTPSTLLFGKLDAALAKAERDAAGSEAR